MKAVWLYLLAACGGGSGTSAVDADPRDVADAAGTCFGVGMVSTCLPALPAQPATLPATLDTGTSADCTIDKDWCVISGTDVDIASSRIVGSRPLVIVATGAITVGGVLDLASRRTGNTVELGAAANATSCIPAQTASQDGGGAGGTFGGRGGNGGIGTLNSAEAGLVVSVTSFRGGCAGADGDGTAAGTGGASGGAVYLIARGSITITGAINASGAAGGGGTAGGGGGGGSGGTIGLEAPSISVVGSVFANGGGGGEGGAAGAAGTNPTTATGPAVGGNGGPGGDGGAGSAGTTRTGVRGGDAPTGGGGGGGGAGVIYLIPTQVTGGVLSPAPS